MIIFQKDKYYSLTRPVLAIDPVFFAFASKRHVLLCLCTSIRPSTQNLDHLTLIDPLESVFGLFKIHYVADQLLELNTSSMAN